VKGQISSEAYLLFHEACSRFAKKQTNHYCQN